MASGGAANDVTIDVRRALERVLHQRVARSVTSAAADGRTVEAPDSAANYVTNALLHHQEGNELLALCAIAFASDALRTAGWVNGNE